MKSQLSRCLLLAFGAFAQMSAQITITVTTSPENVFFGTATPLRGTDSAPLSAGNRLMIGSFDFSGFDSPSAFFGLNGGNLDFLASRFTKFGGEFNLRANRSGDVVLRDGGLFHENISGLVEKSPLANQQLFFWAFETAGSPEKGDLGSGFSNVVAHGIFSGTTSGKVWNFGDSDLPLNSFTARTSDITDIFVGGPGLSLSSLDLVPIPEPSALVGLLGALASLAVLRRRR
jgi:hypothetical protein